MVDVVKILDPLMNENMKADLIFYLAHDKELFFKGMVAVAIIADISMILMFSLGFYFIQHGFLAAGAIIALLVWVPLLEFCNIKQYLHIRKDNLEILEKLDVIYASDDKVGDA